MGEEASGRPKSECFCIKNPDGRCAPCSERLSALIYEFVATFLTMNEKAAAICGPCKREGGDWGGAKAIRELVKAFPLMNDATVICAFVNNFIHSSGLTKTPLMDAEIRRLSQKPDNIEETP